MYRPIPSVYPRRVINSPLHALGGSDSIHTRRVGATPVDPAARPIWKTKISPKDLVAQAVFSGDLAIVVVQPHELAGIRLSNGEEVWRVKDPACRKPSSRSSTPGLRSLNGQVLVLGNDGYAEISPKSGETILFESDEDFPEPPDGLMWKFPYHDACIIDGWQYYDGKWIDRGGIKSLATRWRPINSCHATRDSSTLPSKTNIEKTQSSRQGYELGLSTRSWSGGLSEAQRWGCASTRRTISAKSLALLLCLRV